MTCEIDLIALDDFVEIDSEQLLESPGVRLVSVDEARENFYYPNACVPIDQWRNITSEILGVGTISSDESISKVGLFNLPTTLKEMLAYAMKKYDRFPPHQIQRSQLVESAADAVKTYVVDRFNSLSVLREFNGVGFNSPGLETVTINLKFGQHMGLHYDSWYGTTIKSRLCSRHRIAVNFGPVPRWLLYVPISLQSYVGALKTLHPERTFDEMDEIGSVGDCLVHVNPKVRCVKINPGQGYIAATEAIIHDATTRWATQTTFNYQLLGEFNWLSQNERAV